MKTYFYVDAFNLYFGCCRGTPYKWLDVSRLLNVVFPRNSIESIKYFTARLLPRPNDPAQPTRQKTYLRALRTIDNLEIHYGHFLTHPVRMPRVDAKAGEDAMVEVFKTEEKGSDVNLATELLKDGYNDRFECAIVVSGDSDLLAPIRVVVGELHKPVGVLNPQRKPCRVLETDATFYRHVRKAALVKSQFPTTLHDADGSFTKPAVW